MQTHDYLPRVYPRFTRDEYNRLIGDLIADELTGLKGTILESALKNRALYRSEFQSDHWTAWTLKERGGDGAGQTHTWQCEDLNEAFVALHYGYDVVYKFSGARHGWFADELPR